MENFELGFALAYALIQGFMVGYLVAMIVYAGLFSWPIVVASFALTAIKLFTLTYIRDQERRR